MVESDDPQVRDTDAMPAVDPDAAPGAGAPTQHPSQDREVDVGPEGTRVANPSRVPVGGTRVADPRADTMPESDFDEDDDTIRCRACGADNTVGHRFCGTCGAALVADAAFGLRDPLVGALVGERYRILQRIGAGGMGAVYKVEHTRIGRVAAMKLLHGELSRDERMVKRFKREARAVSRLHSPNTVSVFDYGESNGLVYLVMELLHGRDLGAVLEATGPMDARSVASVVRQSARALAEAHGLGIVHRDLKPHNLFLCDGTSSPRGMVKVLDFGLAKLLEGRDESMVETQADTVMGTPYYMAPEQIDDLPVDGRTDVYALGAVAWCLLTGHPPFRHSTPIGVLHMHLTQPVPSLGDAAHDLVALDGVIRRAMAKDPNKRFATVEAFADAFDSAAERITSVGRGTDTSPLEIVDLPDPIVPDADSVILPVADDVRAIREEFEQFERALRARQRLRALAPVLGLLAVIVVAVFAASSISLTEQRESEPNDELASATPLPPGRVGLGRVDAEPVGGGLDRDVWRIPLPGDGRDVVAVSVTPIPGVDLVLELASASGNYMARSDSGGPGDGETIPNVRPWDDAVYAVVRPTRHNGGEPFHHDSDYELRVQVRAPFEGEELEPNDERTYAQQLIDGQRVLGWIAPSGDLDTFQLPTMDDERRRRLQVSGVAGLDLQVELLDERGERIAVIDRGREGAGESVTLTVDLAARYARIRAVEGADPSLAWILEVETIGPRIQRDDIDVDEDLATGRIVPPAPSRPELSDEDIEAATERDEAIEDVELR